MALNTYITGTISIGAGDTSVVGSSTNWNDANVKAGDTLIVSGHQVLIEDNAGITTLTIDAWPFSAVAAGTSYKIVQTSPLRFGGKQAAQDVSTLIGILNGTGTIYAVSGTLPDPSIGDDGQYALKTNTGIWKLWLKTGGIWVDQGSPVGTNYRGAWNSATTYAGNDTVTLSGSSYISKTINTNKNPTTNPSDWDVLAVAGTNGATWTSGTTVPTGGNNGDYYLLTTTDDIYKNTAGVWSIIVNIKGVQGVKGDTGTAATIAINSVNTLAAGSSATVTNLGTPNIASLQFGIPQGVQGIQGTVGPQGVGVQPDVTGTLTQRATYDGQAKDFKFLQTDVSPFRLWIKASNTSADWAGPSYIGGAAAVGDLGSVADSILQTFDYGVTV